MSIPSERTVRKRLKELRDAIENSGDPLLARIAYEAEQSIRWARENTVGWQTPLQSCIETTKIIRKEIKA